MKVFLQYAPTERPLLLLQDCASAQRRHSALFSAQVDPHPAIVRHRYLSDDEGQRLTYHATDQAATRGDVGEQG